MTDKALRRELSEAMEAGQRMLADKDLAAAEAAFRQGLSVCERSGSQDTGWQSDIALLQDSLGDVLVAQGDLPAALECYRSSMAGRERLRAADPSNAERQRDVSVSLVKIGDVLLHQGQIAEAVVSHRAALEIAENLALADPTNVDRQHDLSILHHKIGDALSSHDPAPARDSYHESLASAERLASADPDNADFQAALAIGYERFGDTATQHGEPAEAIKAFERALAIYEGLAERFSNPAYRAFAVVPLWRLGLLKGAKGRPELQHALDVLKELDGANRLDPKRKHWIPEIEADLASL
ncbi:MAG: tetratricopeptide repeat protein [Pseudomonadota bacterium]